MIIINHVSIVLTYRCEAWTIRKANEKKLLAPKINFVRRTAHCTALHHKQNQYILEELRIQSITKCIQNY